MSSLFHQVASETSLFKAWQKLDKSNPDSHGLSGITLEQFKQNYEERIVNLSQELLENKFKFSPTRAVAIFKKNSEYRPLQIPEIKDRIVLKSIALTLEEKFDSVLRKSTDVSFAYQKGLGVRNAIKRIEKLYYEGNKIILEADIKNFFGEVNKDSLLENQIFPNLEDDTLNNLIRDGLSPKLGGLEKLNREQTLAFKNIDNGIPQGNALSPLLSNIFLSPFDQYLINKGFNLVRYADDFVVMCANREEALDCFEKSSHFLKENLNLELYGLESEKSSILNPIHERFIFLSIEFNGESFFPCIESFQKLQNKIRGVCSLSKDKINLIQLLIKVKNRLEGWVSAYFYTSMDFYVEELDFFIDRQILLAIRKFDWRFTSDSKGELPEKYRNGKRFKDCLSKEQRYGSGIPLAQDILKELRKKRTKTKEKNAT